MFAGDDDGGVDPAGDNPVDEVSPSDDDHFAESVVRGESESCDNHLSGLTTPTSLGEVEDVVAQHWQCNCGPRLPDNAQLTAIRNQQTSEASHHVNRSDADDLDDLETPIPIHLPTGQQSPSTTDVVPTPSVKSRRSQTKEESRGLDKKLVRPELVTVWIQQLRITSVDPLRRFWSRGEDRDRDGDG